MGDLVLDSLEIRGFRGFRHLQIEHLGRVNLIVGKNNVGKSSLLEALQLYAKRADPRLIFELLRSRDENKLSRSIRPYITEVSDLKHLGDEDEFLLALKYLFYGRKDIRLLADPIKVGAMNSPESTLSVLVEWYVPQTNKRGVATRWLLRTEEYQEADDSSLRFTVQLGLQAPINYPVVQNLTLPLSELEEINSVYAKSNLLSKAQIAELWDNVTLTGLEKEVLEALRIVAPGVEGLAFVTYIDLEGRERAPIVKIVSIDERLPLGHLGDGMQRVLSIVLALVNAGNGLLLIDEIENGLHYSIQADLWQLIFKLAHRLNVQVFATTHSWDCIEAFQEAAQKNEQVEGMLISLESRKAGVEAVLFNEEELKVVTRDRIEVR